MDSPIRDGPQCQERQVGCQTEHSDYAEDLRLDLERLEAIVISQQVQLDACLKRLAVVDEELSEIRVRLVRA